MSNPIEKFRRGCLQYVWEVSNYILLDLLFLGLSVLQKMRTIFDKDKKKTVSPLSTAGLHQIKSVTKFGSIYVEECS